MKETLFLKGRPVIVADSNLIHTGNDANIFDIGRRKAVKVYNSPTDEQRAKLRDFPRGLPQRVLIPQELATDQTGAVVGFSMKFLDPAMTAELSRFSEQDFKTTNQISNNHIIPIFRDLRATVTDIHAKDVVIADFNSSNVLVAIENQQFVPYIGDADSFQYGRYQSNEFQKEFVDPRLLRRQGTVIEFVGPHNKDSDWYAFTTMLLSSLVNFNPYGGVYRPATPTDSSLDARLLNRISIFDKEVNKSLEVMERLEGLPDDLLHYFESVFSTQDKRGAFPEELLDIRFTKCTVCGLEHARIKCPARHTTQRRNQPQTPPQPGPVVPPSPPQPVAAAQTPPSRLERVRSFAARRIATGIAAITALSLLAVTVGECNGRADDAAQQARNPQTMMNVIYNYYDSTVAGEGALDPTAKLIKAMSLDVNGMTGTACVSNIRLNDPNKNPGENTEYNMQFNMWDDRWKVTSIAAFDCTVDPNKNLLAHS